MSRINRSALKALLVVFGVAALVFTLVLFAQSPDTEDESTLAVPDRATREAGTSESLNPATRIVPTLTDSSFGIQGVSTLGTPGPNTQLVSTSTTSSPAAQEVSTLKILSPGNGQIITLPAEIHYVVTGFEVGGSTGGHMIVYVGDPESSFQIQIELQAQAGMAVLPDDIHLPGRKDLTFHLADANNQLLLNPESKVTILDLVIQGRK